MTDADWGDTPWQMAHREIGDEGSSAFSVTLGEHTLHLRRVDEGDWCACRAVCADCGGEVAIVDAEREPPELGCTQCGARFTLAFDSVLNLPCMVVDDEVYVLAGDSTLGE